VIDERRIRAALNAMTIKPALPRVESVAPSSA
jgi:hypothetical protein